MSCIATEYQGKLQKRWWCEKPFCRDLSKLQICTLCLGFRFPLAWEQWKLLSLSWRLHIYSEGNEKTFPAIWPKHFTKVWLNGNLVLENYVEGNQKFSAWSGSGGVCRRCAKHFHNNFRSVKVYPSKRSPKTKKFITAVFFINLNRAWFCSTPSM